MKSDDISTVKDFFSGYFHEDWPAESASASDVVTMFLRVGWTAEELHALSRAIRTYAEHHKHAGELERALFEELGCYYRPSADGISPPRLAGERCDDDEHRSRPLAARG